MQSPWDDCAVDGVPKIDFVLLCVDLSNGLKKILFIMCNLKLFGESYITYIYLYIMCSKYTLNFNFIWKPSHHGGILDVFGTLVHLLYSLCNIYLFQCLGRHFVTTYMKWKCDKLDQIEWRAEVTVVVVVGRMRPILN